MALQAGNVNLRSSASSGTANPVSNIYCVVQAIDADKKLAHVRDQVGGLRQVSLIHQIGKGTGPPQEGETWMLTSLFGDWMFAVRVDPDFLDLVTADGTQTLTHKTLTDPVINGTVNSDDGDVVFATSVSALGNISTLGKFVGEGAAPTGSIVMFGGAAAPTGWLFCTGPSLLRSAYPALFAAIGTTYGSVDGTHFNLPDFTSAFPYGAAPGATGGAATHQHSVANHTHALSDNGQAEINSFTNTVSLRRVGTGSWTSNRDVVGSSNTSGGSANSFGAALTGATDSGGPSNTGSASSLPPYTGVNFIIKT